MFRSSHDIGNLLPFKEMMPRRHGSSRGGWLLGTAVAFGAMAAYVQYRTRKAEAENPPMGKFIEVDGVQLHYEDRGQGQPIVFLHGNGAMARELDISGLTDMAAKNYRVIVFDRPGYGYSERPRTTLWDPVTQAHLLHRALLKIGIEKPIVVGHSWASMVAIAMALEHPDYVRSLLLLSGYYYPTARLDALLFSPPALPVIGDLMRHTISPVLGRLIWPAMVRKLFAPAETTPRFEHEYPVWMGLRPSQIRAAAEEAGLMIPSAAKLEKRYRDLKTPVTIMAGAGDLQAICHLHSEQLHKELPQSELIVVPDVGHMIHHSAPDKVMSAIDRLATTSALQENGRGNVSVFPDSRSRSLH
ncbi:pimeloyl-ACP methyl ester carboxylesterase [Paucimonas lemoignei]|uniref:Pimeloyl-ACP methyl ester carboxylesterase n=1 Tax=Paucimonas lemoignei TaxID=29443 RepID=A0A4R3I5L6_PAULE|nr:alpha/beta hydrolase [Paucimonas lemoignei]TCS39299.1 pimeloyl-ACP methyl ester carboxylesterase [Paucimonas lemoignei]